MNPSIDIELLFNKLEKNVKIITINSYLSTYIRIEFSKWRKKNYLSSDFHSEKIQSIIEWTNTLWKSLQKNYNLPILLTKYQEHVLWSKYLSEYSTKYSLLLNNSILNKAKEAWNLIHQWRLPIKEKNWLSFCTKDVHNFYYWYKSFKNLCTKNKWITYSEIYNYIYKKNKKNKNYEHLILIGFNHISPSLKKILDMYVWKMMYLSYKNSSNKIQIFEIENLKKEKYFAIKWALKELKNNPNKKIKIIAPNLFLERKNWEKLSEIFFIKNNIQYYISEKNNMLEHPLVQVLLNLLKMKIIGDYKYIRKIIISPYILGGEKEKISRHFLYLELMGVFHLKWTLKDFQKYIQKKKKTPLLLKIIINIIKEKELKHSKISVWLKFFKKILKISGWPGNQKLNDLEYKTIILVKKIFTKFQEIGLVVKSKISAAQAIDYLSYLFSITSLSSKMSSNIQIYIIDIIENFEILCDKIWICQMHINNFLNISLPNSFIPESMYSIFQFSYFDIAYQKECIKNKILQWKMQSNTVILSYNKKSQIYFDISNFFFQNFKKIEKKNIIDFYQNENKLPKIWDLIKEKKSVYSLNNIEINNFKGGYDVFKTQLQCPFKSVSRYRWKIKNTKEKIYWNAKEQGIVIHKILKEIWKQLKNQKELLYLFKNNQIYFFINNIVSCILSSYFYKLGYHYKKIFFQIEIQRITKLVFDWLLIESQRTPFSVISNEKKIFKYIGKIPIKIQIDRIDQLQNGKKIIIDYKTGHRISRKLIENLYEPQLPLYAIMQNSNGIAYAYINTKSMGFYGIGEISSKDFFYKKIHYNSKFICISWEKQLNNWLNNFKKLSKKFYLGLAIIKPSIISCNYCEFYNFCQKDRN